MRLRRASATGIACLAIAASLELANSHIVVAQTLMIPDATLGDEGSVVVPVDGTAMISGGSIQGPHLFHSFKAFSIDAKQAVYFENPSGINNIFSRVTGDRTSNIQGTLGVQGNASLFLLNPNGIVFGPEAQLDIRGSFLGTTAEAITFGDGLEFSAVAPVALPLLNVVLQPGLQYGAASGAILNQGNLRAGRDLTLGAQRLEVAGSLEAGRDIVLQGQERRLSEAGYTVGGYWLTQDLSGEVVDVVIPHGQVIVSEGDIQLNENYEGPSLYVLAGGQVSQAEGIDQITVTGAAGGVAREAVGDGLGGVQEVIVGSWDEPTVDIRSGVDWVRAGKVSERNTAGLGRSLEERSGGELGWGK